MLKKNEKDIKKFKKAGIIFGILGFVNAIFAFLAISTGNLEMIEFFGPVFKNAIASIVVIGLILALLIYRGDELLSGFILFTWLVQILYIVVAVFIHKYGVLEYFFVFTAISIKAVQSYYLIDALRSVWKLI